MPSIDLTQMRRGYDGNYKRLEVSGFSTDIHDAPGLYLQRVEGCGYDVTELTLEEAEILGNMLIAEAKAVRERFATREPIPQ